MDETAQNISAPDEAARDPADEAGADALLCEDELAAALSEIESTAKAIAESQGDEDAETPPEAVATDESPPEADPEDALTPPDAAMTDEAPPSEDAPTEPTAAGENAESEPDLDAEQEDGASSDIAPNASLAGDISVSNALLGEDDLAAALAEIESTPQSEREDIPSLDDGQTEADGAPRADSVDEQGGEKASAEPVPEHSEESESDSPETATPAENSAAEDPEAASPKPKVRFAIGKKNTEEDGADSATPAAAAQPACAALTDPLTPPAVKKLLRTVDQALETMNRPLARYGDSTRAILGWGALATLIMSLLAMFLLPALLPRRDAITYLKETRARVANPAPPPAAVEAEDDTD